MNKELELPPRTLAQLVNIQRHQIAELKRWKEEAAIALMLWDEMVVNCSVPVKLGARKQDSVAEEIQALRERVYQLGRLYKEATDYNEAATKSFNELKDEKALLEKVAEAASKSIFDNEWNADIELVECLCNAGYLQEWGE